MKKVLAGVVIIGIIGFIFYSRPIEKQTNKQAVQTETNQASKKPSLIQQQLAKKISDVVDLENKGLPRMVDNETRLDKVSAQPGALLTYFYTLPNYAAKDVGPVWIATDGKAKVTKGVCADAELQPLLLAGAKLIYVYKGKDGIYINQFQVAQEDCLRLKP